MYLRKRARDVRTNAADFASFADLPSDIIVHIAEYFSPSDMLKCRLVSGGWRHVWMRNAVLKYYCRLNFPGLMELHGPSPDLEKLFLKTYRSHISPLIDDASRFVPWVAPKIERISESTNTVTYQLTDSDEVQPLSNAPIVKYCDGRVAWQTDWSSIWVDDLRSGQRTLCMLGNNAAIKRQRPQIKAMSSTLVIVSGYVGETVQTRVNRQL
jgi:hypothetical protein